MSKDTLTPLTEQAYQNWRVISVDLGGKEHLLILGNSFVQVRDQYKEAFFDVLDAQEQVETRKIVLQRWLGMADRGRWLDRNILFIPDPREATVAG